MTEKQQKLVDETVNNYLKMDKIKDDVKLSIDDMFIQMSKSVEKNYELFKKEPRKFMAKFIKNYMDENEEAIGQAVILGSDLGKSINEAT